MAENWEDYDAPGQWTRADRLRFHFTLLQVAWGGKTPREMKKLRRQDPLLVDAVEGILNNPPEEVRKWT